MKKIIEWYESLSTPTKAMVYILGAIILGCIGSGVWAKLVEPLLDSIVHSVIILIGKFSSHFIDDLYGAAAQGLYDRSSNMLLLSLAMFCYLGFVTSMRRLMSRANSFTNYPFPSIQQVSTVTLPSALFCGAAICPGAC